MSSLLKVLLKDRLLQAKHGLAIWNSGKIDFEALSNNAILLLLEIPLKYLRNRFSL